MSTLKGCHVLKQPLQVAWDQCNLQRLSLFNATFWGCAKVLTSSDHRFAMIFLSAVAKLNVYDGDGQGVIKSSGKLYWYGTGRDVTTVTI